MIGIPHPILGEEPAATMHLIPRPRLIYRTLVGRRRRLSLRIRAKPPQAPLKPSGVL
ncbi:hypothetical protein [Rhodococcus jostii]|uniref:hypothetical protein n=1 Tax=Rhodococcus jostii TaxID=132919 RepID=UPI003636AF95